jgi:predicted NUDIX family NTP pyrophosphohydrolase
MPKKSAGILLYRFKDSEIQFFLVHPGGPFWAKKDWGAWSIPKGEFDDTENAWEAAKREFQEETGKEVKGDPIILTPIKMKSGKIIHAFALQQDFDGPIHSNSFQLEWPPKSGSITEFPEVDRAGWFALKIAKEKLNASLGTVLDELEIILNR